MIPMAKKTKKQAKKKTMAKRPKGALRAVSHARPNGQAKKPVKKASATAKKDTNKKKADSIDASVIAELKIVSRFASQTILAPIVTEKSAALSSKNVLVFRVSSKATRVAVKQAMKELYHVIPVKVNIVNVHSRETNFGRVLGKTKGYKKAMVTLPPGKTIDVFAA